VTAATKKYFKTTVKVEVLSEKPIEFDNLAELHHQIIHGDLSGQFTVEKQRRLGERAFVSECAKQGTDPEFFGIGKEI
jgi:hypothetical protein